MKFTQIILNTLVYNRSCLHKPNADQKEHNSILELSIYLKSDFLE